MATLTLIGEPFPDREAAAHAEATVELTRAVALAAPRGCSARLLVAADRPAPAFDTPRAVTERLPLNASVLPMLWRTGVTARPLDGEFVHASTPLVALRARGEDDGSQSSVMVPHALGWLAPETMGAATARQYRAFVKRAVKHADVVLTPTHATAKAVQDRFGSHITVQVLPLAAPASYREPGDAAQRRAALGLPERYLVTTALPGEHDRLEWLVQAVLADASLPPVVVLHTDVPLEQSTDADATKASANANPGRREEPSRDGEAAAAKHGESEADALIARAGDRVRIVRPVELADVGAVLSGAELLALPQALIGAGFEVLGALAAGVPVLHSGCESAAELTLDAGVTAESAERFVAELARLSGGPHGGDAQERARLGVLAHDRSRGFTWAGAAMSLWELHANI